MSEIRILTAAVVLMAVFFLWGCGEKQPDQIMVFLDGEEITDDVEIYNGGELGGFTAKVLPEGFEGEVVWKSEDSGVLKVSYEDGVTYKISGKKTGSTRVSVSCGGVSVSFHVTVKKDQNNLAAREVALTIDGVNYSLEKCNLYFVQLYYEFISQYGDQCTSFGLDISKGIGSLASQSCSYGSDGTWYGYFMDNVLSMMPQVQVLCNYAEENGITLDEDDMKQVEEQMQKIADTGKSKGYDDINDFLEACYGDGITEELFREYVERDVLSNKVYNAYQDSLSFTDEELAAAYTDLGYEEGTNDYKTTSMRHILIMAQADENGAYTEEAIQAAHEKIEEIYAEWQAGEQTEESFAELAEKYSEDTGSNENGGLYENIYQGQMVTDIDSWLFDAPRTMGDTMIIDNNGSYVGTHLVFFAGYGDKYSAVLARESLTEAAMSDWYNKLMENVDVEQGEAYAKIGVFQ